MYIAEWFYGVIENYRAWNGHKYLDITLQYTYQTVFIDEVDRLSYI